MNLLKKTKSKAYRRKAHLGSFTHEEQMLLMWFGTYLMLQKKDREEKEERQKNKKQSQWPPKETKVGTCDHCHDTGVTVHKIIRKNLRTVRKTRKFFTNASNV